MTVMLVMFLLLGFAGLDVALRAAAKRAEAARALVLQEARVQAALLRAAPAISLVSPREEGDLSLPGHYCIPGGSFISEGHAWVRIEPGGEVRVGIDDFAQKAAGPVTRVAMPREGQAFRKGDPLFTLECGAEELHFLAPVSGMVVEGNLDLEAAAGSLSSSPYVEGWVCRIAPSDLASELPSMRIGAPAVGWYGDEIRRLDRLRGGRAVLAWADLESAFLVAVR